MLPYISAIGAVLIVIFITLSIFFQSPFYARIIVSKIRKRRMISLECAIKEVGEEKAWFIVYQPLSSTTVFLLPYHHTIEKILDAISDSEIDEYCQEFYIDKNQWEKNEIKLLLNFESYLKKNCYYVDISDKTEVKIFRAGLDEKIKARFLILHHIFAISM